MKNIEYNNLLEFVKKIDSENFYEEYTESEKVKNEKEFIDFYTKDFPPSRR
jgi:hypothetical protein